ncbi:hypothetical protein BLNAU_5503 [Blattamonas nauphoetae]|uniref:Uncharacterized protein n=1 Tax=Blattamonas nauphoetae TaxID=2049346 RepID=A0ABQ9Y711_9EUKA|nr:hypothetical protein BLNAU_5503 [Blattamonas nauphoetae]
MAVYHVLKRDSSALTHLPSPIFPSSSPHQQYSGLSFLAALTKKLRIVFSEFQTNLPTDLSHLPKYLQFTKDDRFIIITPLFFCYASFVLPLHLLTVNPPIEVDSENIQDLLLFIKDTLPTILTNISTIDILIASLPSDSFPTPQLVSVFDSEMAESLKRLRKGCEEFMSQGWQFVVGVTIQITESHKLSFLSIIVDNPSFTDLILHSFRDPHISEDSMTVSTIVDIVNMLSWPKKTVMITNLVGKLFETIDFVSRPLSESKTLFLLTNFIFYILQPIRNDKEARFEQYPRIRVYVFQPAKPFIIFILHNSDKLILDEEDNTQHENRLCWIHNHINNMELRSDEHDAAFVSELVKWEMRTMVEMENEEHFEIVFQSILSRTWKWNRDKPERQKRREVLLREEGWNDAVELRVVGIEVDASRDLVDLAEKFRIEQTFNADDLW